MTSAATQAPQPVLHAAPDRPLPNGEALEVIRLRETVLSLQQDIDGARIQKQQAVQSALAHSEGELKQLRETIMAMREQMENLRAARDTAVRDAIIGANDEIAQLKATVQAL